ncbi:MAG: fructose-bisphosphatase [Candidatus Dadabacteria bacterium RIFCSPHIGHO2_12_FULL_53_21]|nr:MAG: fructose-bisphosphatase [Candidatus Dadabacteria bacterium RIFCSPHIGHO2_12_FULL_53_21]
MIGIETLDEFVIRKQTEFPDARGDLSRLLRDIGLAAKIVNREVNKAGLVDILGSTGKMNVQGEEVKKLDVFANRRFIAALELGGQCCGVASEENKDFITFRDGVSKDANYVVALDPLDGSSNIDVNVSVGTIFSIYRRVSPSEGPVTAEDFLQKGRSQAAAGYIIYGSSTMLVYTTGYGVNGFTLDPSIGEFCLSHPDMKIPKAGKTYSVNQGNFLSFPEGVKQFIRYCKAIDKPTNRPYSLRYIGSMVADIHRNLITGGIFLYPATADAPGGKLRLLYECNPMSFIVEQAGGRATDGVTHIMDIEPRELHQRTPVFIGSELLVLKLEEFLREHPAS